ncbi:MAG: hypothetical protein JKY55_20935 [Aliivibrio sp.]|uniref:hypothetical protein n=1 Tax=Aliivibrio sp. TaxID=1872443 RepID=UPI001A4F7485|nr:hypothetical protein [Aliivibrio sp.]
MIGYISIIAKVAAMIIAIKAYRDATRAMELASLAIERVSISRFERAAVSESARSFSLSPSHNSASAKKNPSGGDDSSLS